MPNRGFRPRYDIPAKGCLGVRPVFRSLAQARERCGGFINHSGKPEPNGTVEADFLSRQDFPRQAEDRF